MNNPTVPMTQMASMGPDILPMWVTWLWLAALSAVLVFHCGQFVRMGGQHRWFHASHILMLVSMLYMFASMEYKWKWFPKSWWVAVFWLSTAAIVGWMIWRFVQRRRLSLLWVVALIMQASMIYMWMPDWTPALTWALVVYFGLETVAWIGGLLDDSRPAMGVGPGERAGVLAVPDSAAAEASASIQPANVTAGLLVESRPATAVAVGVRAVFVPVGHDSAAARVAMAVMASSMAYMFAAMQLMR